LEKCFSYFKSTLAYPIAGVVVVNWLQELLHSADATDFEAFHFIFQNLTGHNAIVNCMAVNPDGVLVSGADNGTMHFWDWKTGYNFQRFQAPVQPGADLMKLRLSPPLKMFPKSEDNIIGFNCT
jgi:WD40 repeat protein